MPHLTARPKMMDAGALAIIGFHADQWHSFQYMNEANQTERVTIARGDVYMGGGGMRNIGLVEMGADAAVLFSAESATPAGQPAADWADRPGQERITEIYLEGDVRITESGKTLRASRILYDLVHERAIMLEPVMQVYEPVRNINIVFRADRGVQLSRSRYCFEDATISTSQFITPPYEVRAQEVTVQERPSKEEGAAAGAQQFDIEMKDSTLNLQSVPVLYWPQATLDSEMAEVPLRSFNIGEHSNFGFGVETEWHLFRTLGLKPPEGVKANLTVDAFEKGTGAGPGH